MAKKILIVIMALVFVLALVACGETADTTAPATDAPETEHVHNFVEETIPATCIATGKIVVKCECGEIQSETEIELADHTASALDCDKDTVCTVCNAVLAEKTGHVFTSTSVVTEATCAAGGKEKGICAVCNKIVETDTPAKAHVVNSASGLTMTDGKYNAKCTLCNNTVALGGADVLLNLTFEEDYATEMAKYPAFVGSTSGINIVDDVDGDKGHLNSQGKVIYFGIADREALASTGYYEISFDFTATGDGDKGTNNGEASIITLMPGQYAAKKTGEIKYGWYFKYNVHLKKFELIAAGQDDSKLDATNSFAVEKGKTYKISLFCDAAAKTNYFFVDGKYIGKCSMNKVSIDITDAQYKENVSIRLGDNGTPAPIIDNFKIQTIK